MEIYACPRCKAALGGRATMAHESLQSNLDRSADFGVELSASAAASETATATLTTSSNDDWLLEREIVRLNRYRTPTPWRCEGHAHLARPEKIKKVSPKRTLAPWLEEVHTEPLDEKIPAFAAGTDLTRITLNPGNQSNTVSLLLALGCSIFSIGATMMLISTTPEYAGLWRHGFAPIFAGQFLILTGILKHLGYLGSRA